MAARATSDAEFIRTLGYYVAGFPKGQATMHPQPSPLPFGSSGFRPELVDDNHVPRHFTAYVVLAFQRSKWTANRAAFAREQAPFCTTGCSRSDIHLGDLGADLGDRLKKKEIERTEV